jgi:ectoine hydroxylase-related dioxygenase (phytanoyl-CoA dioxygenase family)
MRLTDQQLAFFDTFGYLAFPGAFADSIDKIIDSFKKVWADNGGGHFGREHDGKQRSALIQFIDQDEYLSALIDDPRIDDVCASVLGDDYNYTGSDGNFYVGDTRWHSDGYRESKYMSFKMAFYLDPVTADTGCLRVIPGSHKYGDTFGNMLEEVRNMPDASANGPQVLWGVDGDGVPAVPLEAVPGDLVMFNHALKHSSWGGSDRRRMFTLNFEQRYEEEDIPELKDRMGSETRFWIERNYGEVMMKTAGPKRMVHLEQRMSNDGHMTELARKARAEMPEPSRG